MYAQAYARRERACEALGLPVDTSDWDNLLSMGHREAMAANLLDHMENENLLPFDQRHLEGLHYAVGTAAESAERDLGLDEEMPPLDSGLRQREYALFLRVLSKGPKWRNMTIMEKKDIAMRLRYDLAPGRRKDPPVNLLREVGISCQYDGDGVPYRLPHGVDIDPELATLTGLLPPVEHEEDFS